MSVCIMYIDLKKNNNPKTSNKSKSLKQTCVECSGFVAAQYKGWECLDAKRNRKSTSFSLFHHLCFRYH